MNFFSFCRRGALTGMLLLLGITSAQAADWPRQVTDSYVDAYPAEPAAAHCLHQRDAYRFAAGD